MPIKVAAAEHVQQVIIAFGTKLPNHRLAGTCVCPSNQLGESCELYTYPLFPGILSNYGAYVTITDGTNTPVNVAKISEGYLNYELAYAKLSPAIFSNIDCVKFSS